MQRIGLKTSTAVLLVWGLLSTAALAQENRDLPRNDSWATRLEVDGAPNLFKVSDNLFRCAQPTAEGVRRLKETYGIKTVINLRSFHSDRETLGDTGVTYESIPLNAIYPSKEDVARFLKIVTDPNRTPVLVHCQHGADRTGVMCAMYRIIVQGWSKDDAIREMTNGGYGFHAVWVNLIAWVRQANVAEIRRQSGLEQPAAAK